MPSGERCAWWERGRSDHRPSPTSVQELAAKPPERSRNAPSAVGVTLPISAPPPTMMAAVAASDEGVPVEIQRQRQCHPNCAPTASPTRVTQSRPKPGNAAIPAVPMRSRRAEAVRCPRLEPRQSASGPTSSTATALPPSSTANANVYVVCRIAARPNRFYNSGADGDGELPRLRGRSGCTAVERVRCTQRCVMQRTAIGSSRPNRVLSAHAGDPEIGLGLSCRRLFSSPPGGVQRPATDRRRLRHRSLTFAALLLAAAVVGCGRDSQPVDSVSGCESQLTGGSVTVPVHDRDRKALVRLPGSGGAERHPVVLAFHGAGESAVYMETATGITERATAAGMIVAYLDQPSASVHWDITSDTEVQFVDALLDLLEAEACADRGMVSAVGFSRGAGVVHRLACASSDRLLGAAMVGGMYVTAAQDGCDPDTGVTIIAIHAADDSIVPLDGGVSPDPTYELIPVREWMSEWSDRNGCADDPAVDTTAHAEVTTWVHCDAATELHVVETGGHAWLGGPLAPHEFSATDAVWAFLYGR